MTESRMKELLKMAKPVRQPAPVILTFGECMLLHKIIMNYPNGTYVPQSDKDVDRLRDEKFVVMTGCLWFPTEDGIYHMKPYLKNKAAAH